MISLEHVSFSYRKKGSMVLRDISLTAEDGRCTVLMGENGSGKSTAIAIMAGILTPNEGKVTRSGSLGYVPQDSALFDDMTVMENLKFFAGIAGKELPADLGALPFDIAEFRGKKVGSLSGGMKKRVSIACALIGNPQTILLDEPHSSLDAHYRAVLSETVASLRKAGKCIIYVGHREDEYMDFCDTRYLLSGGALSPCPAVEIYH